MAPHKDLYLFNVPGLETVPRTIQLCDKSFGHRDAKRNHGVLDS
jgi:hypothetical protein